METVCCIYRDRGPYRSLLLGLAGRAWQPLASSLPDEFALLKPKNEVSDLGNDICQDQTPDYTVRSNMVNDLRSYQARYNPPNDQGFCEQYRNFERLLQLLSSHHIRTLVVNMPLTSENRSLLAVSTARAYKQAWALLPQQFGADQLDFSTSAAYTQSDFEDSAHLNAVGGNKLFQAIAQYVADRKLCPNPSGDGR